jgi:hypothetical protein
MPSQLAPSNHLPDTLERHKNSHLRALFLLLNLILLLSTPYFNLRIRPVEYISQLQILIRRVRPISCVLVSVFIPPL